MDMPTTNLRLGNETIPLIEKTWSLSTMIIDLRAVMPIRLEEPIATDMQGVTVEGIRLEIPDT